MTGLFSPVHILIVLTVRADRAGPPGVAESRRAPRQGAGGACTLRARLDEEIHGMIDDDEPGSGAARAADRRL